MAILKILESFEVKSSRKYRWRFVVKDESIYSLVSTDWQWCEINHDYGFDFWRNSNSFPTYNFNDGMYAGLPKFLSKEYEKHNLRLLYDKWSEIKASEYIKNNNFNVGDILDWEQHIKVNECIRILTKLQHAEIEKGYFEYTNQHSSSILIKELSSLISEYTQ